MDTRYTFDRSDYIINGWHMELTIVEEVQHIIDKSAGETDLFKIERNGWKKKYEHLQLLAQINPTLVDINYLWVQFLNLMGNSNGNFDESLFRSNIYDKLYGSSGGAYDPLWETINKTKTDPWWGEKSDLINCN